jgi:hypothetical protein
MGHSKVSGSNGTLEGYLAEADDGCIVYDASEANSASFIEWVISGPMLDPALKPGTDNKFTKKDLKALARMAPGLEGGFRTAGALAAAGALDGKKYGSGDFVALDIWMVHFKKAVPDVKWGKVIKGQVVWEA